MGGKDTVKAVTDWKFLAITGGISVTGIIGMYIMRIGFFKPKPPTPPPEFWACEKDKDGFNTGYCVQLDAAKAKTAIANFERVFPSQALCDAEVKNGTGCKKYYRCERDSSGFNDGKIAQCHSYTDHDTGLLCPYNDPREAVTCGKFTYRCDHSMDPKGKDVATCTRINADDAAVGDVVYFGPTDQAARDSCSAQCKSN